MFRSSSLRDVLSLSCPPKGSRRPFRQRHTVRLTLEALEDRVVPSAVNSVHPLLTVPPNTGGTIVTSHNASTPNATATPMQAPAAAPTPTTVTATAENPKAAVRPKPGQLQIQPGQQLRLAAFISDAPNIAVTGGTLEFKVLDAAMNPVRIDKLPVKNLARGGVTKVEETFLVPNTWPPGKYTVQVTYTGTAKFGGSTTTTSFTVAAPPPPPPGGGGGGGAAAFPCVPDAQNSLVQAFEQLIDDLKSMIAQFFAAENSMMQYEAKYFLSETLIPLEDLNFPSPPP
jgi:hypothetical protein